MNKLVWVNCPYSAMPDPMMLGWIVEIWDGETIFSAVIEGENAISNALDDFLDFYHNKGEQPRPYSYALFYRGSLVTRDKFNKDANMRTGGR